MQQQENNILKVKHFGIAGTVQYYQLKCQLYSPITLLPLVWVVYCFLGLEKKPLNQQKLGNDHICMFDQDKPLTHYCKILKKYRVFHCCRFTLKRGISLQDPFQPQAWQHIPITGLQHCGPAGCCSLGPMLTYPCRVFISSNPSFYNACHSC